MSEPAVNSPARASKQEAIIDKLQSFRKHEIEISITCIYKFRLNSQHGSKFVLGSVLSYSRFVIDEVA